MNRIEVSSLGEDGIQGTTDDFSLTDVVWDPASGRVRPKPPAPHPTRAVVTGSIRDGAGGVLPGATVRLLDADEKIAAETTSLVDGTYSLKVVPGAYTLRCDLFGFASFQRYGLYLEAGEAIEADGVLTVEGMEISLHCGASQLMVTPRADTILAGPEELPTATIATPPLRSRQPETAVWLPTLEVDAAGEVPVDLVLPYHAPTWSLAAVVSTLDGRFAIANRDLQSFEPFLAHPEDPPPQLVLAP